MSYPESDVLQELRSLIGRPGYFDELRTIGLTVPNSSRVLVGILEKSTLTVFPHGDMEFAQRPYTLEKLPTEKPGVVKDVGTALPNGFYYLYHEVAHPPGGRSCFPLFFVTLEKGVRTYVSALGSVVSVTGEGGLEFVEGRGMLIYNNTARTEPLFGVLSYEMELWKAYEIRFIDLCANYARGRLYSSRLELEKLKSSARSQDEAFRNMVQTLRSKAVIYHALESLRDSLNLLVYLRKLSMLFTPAAIAERLGITGEMEKKLTTLVQEITPEIEKKLTDAGKVLTLEQLVNKMDESLQMLRAGAPLLGRLKWSEIDRKSNDDISRTVISVADDLLKDNRKSLDMLQDDMEDIRRLLNIVPPRVMGIPRIVSYAEAQDKATIDSNAEYFMAVLRLKEQAAMFPVILGFASLVFSFFCPPAGVALGFMSAMVSVDSAIFKDALSDSELNPDKTFVSQAEAREAWFWAGVDVLFACVDGVQMFKSAREIMKELKAAKGLESLPRNTDELAKLGDISAEDMRTLERGAEAADARALDRAVADIDQDAARQATAKARDGQVDMSRPPRVEEPSSAAEMIEQADPEVRRSLMGTTEVTSGPKGGMRKVAIKDVIEDEYVKYFDDVMEQRKAARAAGKPLPPPPRSFDDFARVRYREIVNQKPPKTFISSQADFYDDIARTAGRPIDDLLGDAAALRDALVKKFSQPSRSLMRRAKWLSETESSFFSEFSKAIKRGDSTAALDDLIRQKFLKPIDDVATRAGFAAGQGRSFGLFGTGLRNITRWTDDAAVRSLRNLFEHPGMDKAALQKLMNNRNLTRHASTALMNQDLAKALDKIKAVDGVMNRVTAKPSMFEALITGNRGHAFEAILTARLVDPAAQAGAKISVGRRWWLDIIDKYNATGGAKYTNVLEADILVELSDGRRILIDAKFYEHGVEVFKELDSQLAKIASGIDEGIIHNAEYWVSHHFVASKQGLSNLDAFRLEADMYTHGRLSIVHGTYESGFPANFFDSSRFLEVSRGDVILVPPQPNLGGLPISGPSKIPATPVPKSTDLVPTPGSVSTMVPQVKQADVIRADTAVSADLRRSFIPLSPLATTGRVKVVSAPVDEKIKATIRGFTLRRVSGDTNIEGTGAYEYAVGPVSEGDIRKIVRAATPAAFTSTGEFKRQTSPLDLYLLWVQASAFSGSIGYQALLFTETGRLLDVWPDESAFLRLEPGGNAIALTTQRIGSTLVYPFEPGHYIWALRLKANDKVLTYPDTIKMTVKNEF